jgi:hypothetical protein
LFFGWFFFLSPYWQKYCSFIPTVFFCPHTDKHLAILSKRTFDTQSIHIFGLVYYLSTSRNSPFYIWNGKQSLERASDNDLLLCRKSTSNKTCYRQWFDRRIISKMILKSGSNWLFLVVFSVEITLSGSHSGNSFEFSHRLTGFLNLIPYIIIIIRANGPTFRANREWGQTNPDSRFAMLDLFTVK